jgi:ferredoxin
MKFFCHVALLGQAGAFTVNRFKAPMTTDLSALISIDLEKPLGIILEEIEENAAKGVKVEELSDSGSAYASEYRNQLVGSKVMSVNGKDVTTMIFDDVMDCIINAPSPVNVSFDTVEADGETDEVEENLVQYDVGATVEIKVIQEGNEDKVISAKVGDNLRKSLLENNVELYRGLKKKLGNCGGGGQCTFCAVDFVEGQGWKERSDYENKKIAKYPTARLACMNNIQGPCVIRVE